MTPQKEFHTQLTCCKMARTSALGGGRHHSFHPGTGRRSWDADAKSKSQEEEETATARRSWRKFKAGTSSHYMETQKGVCGFSISVLWLALRCLSDRCQAHRVPGGTMSTEADALPES